MNWYLITQSARESLVTVCPGIDASEAMAFAYAVFGRETSRQIDCVQLEGEDLEKVESWVAANCEGGDTASEIMVSLGKVGVTCVGLAKLLDEDGTLSVAEHLVEASGKKAKKK